MSRFSMAVVALVWFLPVTHANTVLPFDDECVSAECALNALQARALAVSGPSKQNASDSTIPGLLDPDISDVLPDPDGDSSESGPDEEVSDPSGSGLCSGEAYDRSKEGCCAGTLYDRISEGCCNGDIYDVEHEDCCGGKESYDTRTQGCCNDEQVFDLGQEYLVFGLQCLAPVEPQEDKIPWNCTKEWPPSNYASVWKRYCATKSEDSHMAWAMTPSCQVGWLSVKQTSKSAAEQNALEQCQSRATAYNQETCHIFDLDGKLCARQRCGSKLHDATMIGCCNGREPRRYDLLQVLGVVVVAAGVGTCTWPNLHGDGLEAFSGSSDKILAAVGLFLSYGFISFSLVLKELAFVRFKTWRRENGHKKGELNLEMVNFATALWQGWALMLLWPVNFALLTNLDTAAYFKSAFHAFKVAGPWLVAYLAVNLVYTEVTTMVLKQLSAVIFLLVNVLNVPLVSLFFCFKLPLLGAAPFRWSFVAGLVVIIGGLLTYNHKTLTAHRGSKAN